MKTAVDRLEECSVNFRILGNKKWKERLQTLQRKLQKLYPNRVAAVDMTDRFSLAFMRNVLRDQAQGEQPLIEVNETFRQDAEAHGIYSQALIERVAREGTLAHIEGVPEHIKRVFVCAHDISPEWHVQMQAAFQRH